MQCVHTCAIASKLYGARWQLNHKDCPRRVCKALNVCQSTDAAVHRAAYPDIKPLTLQPCSGKRSCQAGGVGIPWSVQLTKSQQLQQAVRLGSSGFKRQIQMHMVTHTLFSCIPSR